jgi:peptidyl-prolyl cis-trans isomerase C
MLKQFSIRQLLESVEVSEEEMKDFYEQNQDRFEKGEEVTASHILVKTEDEAKAARERVVGGEAFGDVAQDVSTCPSKERGGDLGAFSKGRMVPEFEQVAFDMEVDEISEPVKTQFGYHIIKVTDKSDASKLSYDETKGEIRQRLTVEKQNKVYLDKVEALKGAYDVEIVE